MRTWLTLSAAAFAAFLATPARADAAFIVAGLGSPDYSGGTATLDVTFAFTGDPGDTLEAFQLSVIGSDPLLTASGADYSRFSFTPDASLSGWAGFPDAFGTGGFVAYFDLLGGGLAPSATPYLLGTLTVDLSGLNSPSPLTVTLNGQDPLFPTSAVGTIGGTPDFIPVDASGASAQLGVTAVPEPNSAVLLAAGCLALGCRRLAGRRSAARAVGCGNGFWRAATAREREAQTAAWRSRLVRNVARFRYRTRAVLGA